ncbi:hypothetical protein [Actinomadura rudentiformis]|uniref:DUF4333 domain-containing protein n=1 Tax=Actinomadura rudentiformis TaxID=359158 RepID=A0A6H9YN99_9ACTN|nr:hypothetical protein [Actinomadura rudentiformis]KAB2342099.1 hypothetical protein F8566_39175 [Actinomadura rudentiformis]
MRALRAGLLAALLVCTLSACDLMQRISDGAYRNAVADGTVAELEKRGVRLAGRPSCEMPATGDESLVRVRCTGRTTTGVPVVVSGEATQADTDHPREQYVITVGGKPVLDQNCLGLGCPPASS